MADWPRWIDLSTVDSYAMYSAYLNYEYRMQQSYEEIRTGAYRPVWSGHLTMIIHKLGDDTMPGIRLPGAGKLKETPCRQAGCARCEQGQGGYQFKWYSPHWARHYNSLKRRGAWEAPQPGEEPTASSGLRFWERASSADAAP